MLVLLIRVQSGVKVSLLPGMREESKNFADFLERSLLLLLHFSPGSPWAVWMLLQGSLRRSFLDLVLRAVHIHSQNLVEAFLQLRLCSGLGAVQFLMFSPSDTLFRSPVLLLKLFCIHGTLSFSQGGF